LIKISEQAQEKISKLINNAKLAMPNNELFLRITAVKHECSNIKHQVYFDYETRDNDLVYIYDEAGIELRVDKESLSYIENLSIDYVDTAEKQEFTIDNPDAEKICQCNK